LEPLLLGFNEVEKTSNYIWFFTALSWDKVICLCFLPNTPHDSIKDSLIFKLVNVEGDE
jgi:hypothetical protein